MSLANFLRKYSNWAAFDKKSLANIFLKPQNQIISNLVGFGIVLGLGNPLTKLCMTAQPFMATVTKNF
jgi:hypothetical protein